jgi:hypothetical protein
MTIMLAYDSPAVLEGTARCATSPKWPTMTSQSQGVTVAFRASPVPVFQMRKARQRQLTGDHAGPCFGNCIRGSALQRHPASCGAAEHFQRMRDHIRDRFAPTDSCRHKSSS